jgi:NTE family protein
LRAENALSDLSAESKMESDWGFLTMLRDRGRTYATEWLNENYDDIGKRSTVDVKKAFL